MGWLEQLPCPASSLAMDWFGGRAVAVQVAGHEKEAADTVQSSRQVRRQGFGGEMIQIKSFI